MAADSGFDVAVIKLQLVSADVLEASCVPAKQEQRRAAIHTQSINLKTFQTTEGFVPWQEAIVRGDPLP